MPKIDFRTYLKLEKALATKLKDAWKPTTKAAYKAIEKAVNAGDFATAYKVAHEIDGTDLGLKNREYIKYLLLACANYGAANAAGTSVTFVRAGSHESFLNRVADGFATSLEYNLTVTAVTSALQSIAEAERKSKEALKADNPRYLRPLVEFADPANKTIQLVSSLHSSRLATWGFTAESEILGHTEYQLSGVMDGRTSAFCKLVNGMKFSVADARASIVNILNLQDPNDAKTLQPWPKQSKADIEAFRGMSAEELTAKNLHIPPFHPNCRTILVAVRKPPRDKKPMVTEDNQILEPSISTKDTFNELGLDISDKALAHWNDYMGVSPVSVLAKLSGETAEAVIMGALTKKFRQVVIGANGDIKLSLKAVISKSGKFSANAVIDPFTGTIYPNMVAFNNASPLRAAEFFKTFYGGMVDVGVSVGATEMVSLAAGETGAFMHVQAGFLPSATAWADTQAKLLLEIAEGGQYAEAFALLDEAEQALVTKLLGDTSTQALYILANLPFEVKGMAIGQLLTQNLSMEMTLNLDNATALANAAKVFK